jgi:hypothetical protein
MATTAVNKISEIKKETTLVRMEKMEKIVEPIKQK